MPRGFHNRVLHVDLASGSFHFEQPGEAFFRRYGGGSALGLYYVLKHTPAGCDALGAENTLVLAAGVVTGAPISGNSRLTAVAKSPLSEAIGDSQSGGFFPAQMKFAGVDAIVLHQRSPEPLYLWINEGLPQLRPAAHLMGKPTAEVEDLIKTELGDAKVEILQTGPAGERGVRFASLISMANRANGRTGMGAVMGSKNLKAVVVRGRQPLALANPEGLGQLARWGAQNFEQSDVYSLGLLGTAEIVRSQDRSGGLPTRNWQSGTFAGAASIDGQTMAETILKRRDTCYACIVRCKRVVETNYAGRDVERRYGGPEYETLATFGSYCGIDDLEAVAMANQLCNRYGMDTISCGATIAWAMECFEKGLISRAETGGIDLRFGHAAGMLAMVELIAERQGFGDLLAEGSAGAAARLGRGTQDLVATCKGVELPAHMPQVKRSLALIYASNPFGADHQSSEHDPSYRAYPDRMAQIGLSDPQPSKVLNDEKVRFALRTQYLYSALDSLSICQFVFGPAWQLYGPDQLVEMVALVTGWDVSIEELLRLGERRLNMLRAFNAREGFGRDADRLPKKLFQALQGGRSAGLALSEGELEAAKDAYYQQAGWDRQSGNPSQEKLSQLGLGWVADLLAI